VKEFPDWDKWILQKKADEQIEEILQKSEAHFQRAIANFNNQVKPKHIKYHKDAGHAYASIDHPAAHVQLSNPKHQEKFDDHVNSWLSLHDESGSDKYPHDH
jgi:hypothetical protein